MEDAQQAAALGADALGFVFYAPSPRAVDTEIVAEICRDLPPFVSKVALFVDPETETVETVLSRCPIDLLQFHGRETPEFCRQFDMPYLKALAMRPELDVAATMADYADASGILLDAWHPAVPGGTGETFDWDRIPAERLRPLILAGGLTPDNVGEAIRRTHPFGVDVSSGVEAAKGIKDSEKLLSFIRGVARVDTESDA